MEIKDEWKSGICANSIPIGIDIIKPGQPSGRMKNAIGADLGNSLGIGHRALHLFPTMSSMTEPEASVIPN